jgi:hypothetical protein
MNPSQANKQTKPPTVTTKWNIEEMKKLQDMTNQLW